jgi:hypothetical protein
VSFVLLSTSRVYSISPLVQLAVEVREGAFVPTKCAIASIRGIWRGW